MHAVRTAFRLVIITKASRIFSEIPCALILLCNKHEDGLIH